MKYIGVMSGTSVDGLDVALLEARGEEPPSILAATTAPFPPALATALRTLAQPGTDDVDSVGAVDARLGSFVGETVAVCLRRWKVAANTVRAIGTHGQTIRHRPNGHGGERFTVQIGDPNRIAEITGIDTVADFRRRDLAAGGQGAPLVPLFHDALFRHRQRNRFVVNIGGIANVTVLPAGSTELLGFDIGPGNALLDAWVRHCRGEDMDRDGAWAAAGAPAPELLGRLRRDPFLARKPPKSTGKETYHLGYVRQACGDLALGVQDVQATLAEFTAGNIAAAIERWGPGRGDVLLCGGGRRNVDLVERLAARLSGYEVLPTDDCAVNGDALEAAAFAWLAHRTIHRLPGNAPAATGAHGPRVLGAVYPGGGSHPVAATHHVDSAADQQLK